MRTISLKMLSLSLLTTLIICQSPFAIAKYVYPNDTYFKDHINWEANIFTICGESNGKYTFGVTTENIDGTHSRTIISCMLGGIAQSNSKFYAYFSIYEKSTDNWVADCIPHFNKTGILTKAYTEIDKDNPKHCDVYFE